FFSSRRRHTRLQGDWSSDVCSSDLALQRAKTRLARARIGGHEWYWPPGEYPGAFDAPADAVRLLAPFDPLVKDRVRFELLWGWEIGRASCRERGWCWVGVVGVMKKR